MTNKPNVRRHGEGTIHRRRSDGRWTAAVSAGPGRKRRWYYGRSEAEVRRKLKGALREQEEGRLSRASSPRIGAYLEAWLRDLEASGRVRASTLKRYGELLAHATPLAQIRLADLTVDDVQGLLNRKRSDLSPRTIGHLRSVLRTALNDAMRTGIVGRNVAELARPPRVPEREGAFLNVVQARALLAAARGNRLEALYSVGIALGLRPGELLGLRWSDVDEEKGDVQVRQQLVEIRGQPPQLLELKTRAGRRTIRLPKVAVEALRTHHARQSAERLRVRGWRNLDLVFPDLDGTPMAFSTLRGQFRRVLAKAGLQPIRFYDATRHTSASLLAAQGVHPRVMKEILGHAHISTTLGIYAHVAPETSAEAAAAIDRALGLR